MMSATELIVRHTWFRTAFTSPSASLQEACALSSVIQLSPTFNWILYLKFSGLNIGLPFRSTRPVILTVYIVMFQIINPDIGTATPVPGPAVLFNV